MCLPLPAVLCAVPADKSTTTTMIDDVVNDGAGVNGDQHLFVHQMHPDE